MEQITMIVQSKTLLYSNQNDKVRLNDKADIENKNISILACQKYYW